MKSLRLVVILVLMTACATVPVQPPSAPPKPTTPSELTGGVKGLWARPQPTGFCLRLVDLEPKEYSDWFIYRRRGAWLKISMFELSLGKGITRTPGANPFHGGGAPGGVTGRWIGQWKEVGTVPAVNVVSVAPGEC